MSANHERRRTSGVFLVAFALLFVVAAVVAVNAISTRQIEARRLNERADLLEQDAQLIIGQVPQGFRDDRGLADSAALPSTDTAAIADALAPAALQMGVTLSDADTEAGTRLAEQLITMLDLDAAPGDPTVEPIARAFAVRGDIHAISNFLELVGRGSLLLVLSPVEFTFDDAGPTATFAVAALHVTIDSPADRLARQRVARAAAEGTP